MSENNGIGVRVRAARGRLGWSRETLAFHTGLSWAAITQVESGRRTNVWPGTLAALSRALGVSIDYLVAGAPPRPTMLEHALLPYRSDDQLRHLAGAFLADGVARSEATVAVMPATKIELLRDELGSHARSVKFIEAESFFRTPCAALEGYRAFAEAHLRRGVPWIRILGEPAWDEKAAEQVQLWNRYEALLNLVFAAYPLSIVCPYDERAVAPEILRQARLTHPKAFGSERIARSGDYADPVRFALEP